AGRKHIERRKKLPARPALRPEIAIVWPTNVRFGLNFPLHCSNNVRNIAAVISRLAPLFLNRIGARSNGSIWRRENPRHATPMPFCVGKNGRFERREFDIFRVLLSKSTRAKRGKKGDR